MYLPVLYFQGQHCIIVVKYVTFLSRFCAFSVYLCLCVDYSSRARESKAEVPAGHGVGSY